MLNHPWLNRTDNYDYKYSDKEYEVMMLKKDIKEKMYVKQPRDDSASAPKDMGYLEDTDDQGNEGDIENESDYSLE